MNRTDDSSQPPEQVIKRWVVNRPSDGKTATFPRIAEFATRIFAAGRQLFQADLQRTKRRV